MKVITILSLLLLASPVFGELTKEDLRTVIREEITASEKRTREYINLKIEVLDKSLNAKIDAVNAKIDGVDKSLNARIDGVEKRMDGGFDALNTRMDDVDSRFDRIWLAIIALITAAIALPQLIILYAERKRGREVHTLIEQLREKKEPPLPPS